MDEESDRFASLTDAEKEALRAYLASSDVKEVARRIGRSPHTAEQRLGRARRKLGVRRSLDAALILARIEDGTTYGSAIYSPSGIAAEGAPAPDGAQVEPRQEALWSAFPTKRRPWNSLPVSGRILWILLGLFALLVCVVLMADLMETATRIDRLRL